MPPRTKDENEDEEDLRLDLNVNRRVAKAREEPSEPEVRRGRLFDNSVLLIPPRPSFSSSFIKRHRITMAQRGRVLGSKQKGGKGSKDR